MQVRDPLGMKMSLADARAKAAQKLDTTFWTDERHDQESFLRWVSTILKAEPEDMGYDINSDTEFEWTD
jgi:hypothetical protein